jgi:nucleoside 2-deoxyribosyltransferase
MKLIYVAGPFRGKDSWAMECNIRRAEAIALEVWRGGFACICPHSNTRFFQGAADDKVWLEGDLEILKRCDAVIMTPNWRTSSGAKAEYLYALAREIPVFYYQDTVSGGLPEALYRWAAASSACENIC